MENKDIEKYQEIWEGLFFLHILLTKIYMEVIRGGFLYILYLYKTYKNTVIHTIQNMF